MVLLTEVLKIAWSWKVQAPDAATTTSTTVSNEGDPLLLVLKIELTGNLASVLGQFSAGPYGRCSTPSTDSEQASILQQCWPVAKFLTAPPYS